MAASSGGLKGEEDGPRPKWSPQDGFEASERGQEPSKTIKNSRFTIVFKRFPCCSMVFDEFRSQKIAPSWGRIRSASQESEGRLVATRPEEVGGYVRDVRVERLWPPPPRRGGDLDLPRGPDTQHEGAPELAERLKRMRNDAKGCETHSVL